MTTNQVDRLEQTQLNQPSCEETRTHTPTRSSESPIARQPLTNLALICRYLTPKELLAIDKTCRLLSEAASHPLTFQQETEVGVEHDLYHCRSYARGPVGIFGRDASKLRRALKSRLFRHFRIVELRCGSQFQLGIEADEYLHQTLVGWFGCLVEDATTPIKALTIEIHCNYTRMRPTCGLIESRYFHPSIFETWSQSKSMQYLSLLHLQVDEGLTPELLKYLPPSVRILHVTLTNFNCSMESIVEAISGSPAHTQINQLIFDSNPHVLFTRPEDLAALEKLDRPLMSNIEVIHWCLPLDGASGHRFEEVESLKLSRITMVTVIFPGRNWRIIDQTIFERLDIFTDLKYLVFTVEPSFSQHICESFTEWPSTVRESLQTIRVEGFVGASMVDCLVAAGLQQLLTLIFDSPMDKRLTCIKLLQASPTLTSLSMHSLRNIDIYFPYTLLDDPNLLKTALPSLTELQLQQSPFLSRCSGPPGLIPNQFLFQIPNLKRIRWGTKLDWMTPSEASQQIIKEHEEDLRAIEVFEASQRKKKQEYLAKTYDQQTNVFELTSTPSSNDPSSLTTSINNFQPFSLMNDSSAPLATETASPPPPMITWTTLAPSITPSTNPFTLTPTTGPVAEGTFGSGVNIDHLHQFSSTSLRSNLFSKKVSGKKTLGTPSPNRINTAYTPITDSPTSMNTPSFAFAAPTQMDDLSMKSVAPVSFTNPFTLASPITENSLTTTFANPFLVQIQTPSGPPVPSP